MRHCETKLLGWIEQLGVRFARKNSPGLEQQVVQCSPRKSSSFPPIYTRTVVATQRFHCGEVIARIPDSSILCGRTAAAALARTSPELLHEISAFAKQSNSELSLPLTTRDPLLMLVVMALGKLQDPRVPSYGQWMQKLPVGLPPIGALLAMCRSLPPNPLDSSNLSFADDAVTRKPSHQERAVELETQLQSTVVKPLTRIFRPFVAPSKQQNLLSLVHWACFMLRSRAVLLERKNKRSRGESSSTTFPALVPFIDLLNHSSARCNVTFTLVNHSDLGGEVVASAVRDIQPGSEICLDYGNVWQRGALFPLQQHNPLQKRRTEEVRRQLNEYRQEVMTPIFPARESATEAATKAAIHSDDAAWIWMFGFIKSDEDREYEHSLVWHNGLQDRIAQMTDVRRKGQPGEFVVGVPEGLAELKKTRERLRVKYGPHVAFPEPPSEMMEALLSSSVESPQLVSTVARLPDYLHQGGASQPSSLE